MKLGRLPHHPERLARAMMGTRLGVVAPPPVLDRSALDYEPQMFSNDVVGDCTCAGLANSAIGYGVAFGGGPPPIDPSMPLAFYADCIGQPSATEQQLAVTNGAVLLDVIQDAINDGFITKVYPDGTHDLLVPVHQAIPNARDAIAEALISGSVEIGIAIYQRDMDVFGNGPWTAAPADSGTMLGGHALVIWDYAGLADDSLVRLATWGTLQPCSWAWLMARLDEAHGLMWPQLARAA